MEEIRELTSLRSTNEEDGVTREIISTMNYSYKMGCDERFVVALRPLNAPNRIIFAFFLGDHSCPIKSQDDYEKIREMFVSRWKSEYRNDEDELHRLLEGADVVTQEQPNKDGDKITLTMEDGTEAVYTIMITFEHNGKDFVVLDPDTEDDDDPFLVYSYRETENGLELIEVDDDEYDMGLDVLEEYMKSFD